MLTLPPDTEKLARRVAERRGKTPEDVVKTAIETEARLAGVTLTDSGRKQIDLERVRDIVRRVASRPLRDFRPAREILDEAWSRG